MGPWTGGDVAQGTCRAGALRLAPVGAAWHLPGPAIGPGRCLAGPKGARPLPTNPMGALGPCRGHRPALVAERALMGASGSATQPAKAGAFVIGLGTKRLEGR